MPSWGQMNLAVLEPEGKGLSKDEQWMLSLVQSSIAADINKYSAGAITIIDRQNLEAIIAEQKRSLSAMTSDEAIRIGNLANASHILVGKITKTPKTFMLELSVTDVETGKRKASFSPKSVTLSSLEDLSILKEASADLLKQLGVTLTDSLLADLKGPIATAQIQAQTALARGVFAQRQGTSVAALSYYYQAAAFDPTLVEAVSRSSVVSANISGINLGENIRNDIEWRKKWVEQLKETEETFKKIIDAADPPYKLLYSTVIETKNINYQKETADLNINIHMLANVEWFNALQRSLKAAMAVKEGLNATNRKKDWGLDRWPGQGVSETNPFVLRMEYERPNSLSADVKKQGEKQYNFIVGFELVNQKGKVIGKQGMAITQAFGINGDFAIAFIPKISSILTFRSVDAKEISDNLTIRVTSVNGTPVKNAKFPITAISTKEAPENQIKRIVFTDTRDGKEYKAVEIGLQTWMAENLNFDAEGSKKCYDNNESNCDKYGKLYNWNTALNACPLGWHLPNNDEWRTLVSLAGADKIAGNALYDKQRPTWYKEGNEAAGYALKAFSGWNDYGDKSGNGMNYFGFSALPGGNGSKDDSFRSIGESGSWWSAQEDDTKGRAYYWNIHSCCDSQIDKGYSEQSSLYSVRCVKDIF